MLLLCIALMIELELPGTPGALYDGMIVSGPAEVGTAELAAVEEGTLGKLIETMALDGIETIALDGIDTMGAEETPAKVDAADGEGVAA